MHSPSSARWDENKETLHPDVVELGVFVSNLIHPRCSVMNKIADDCAFVGLDYHSSSNAWTKAWLAWLRENSTFGSNTRWVLDRHLKNLDRVVAEVREVEDRMKAVTKDDTVVQRLLRQKGVGLVTAVMLRAEVGGFERFRCGKQLARYCAVTPLNAASGQRQIQLGLINAGNLSLRGMLIEMADRLCRYSPSWRAMKDRMLKRGKPRSVIAAAVANRWVRRLFWQLQQPESAEAEFMESTEDMSDTLCEEPPRIELFDEFNRSQLSATA